MRFVGITPRQGKRITRGLKRIENAYTPDQRIGRIVPWQPGVLRARVTSAIASGSWLSPGSGEVQVYHKSPTSGSWEKAGDPVACLNDQNTGDVAEHTTCKVAWISGELWLVQADCEPSPFDGEDDE